MTVPTCGHGRTGGVTHRLPTVLTQSQIEFDRILFLPTSQSLQESAASLVSLADRLSQTAQHDSPFAKKARLHRLQYSGGKPDDITVVLATVQKEE